MDKANTKKYGLLALISGIIAILSLPALFTAKDFGGLGILIFITIPSSFFTVTFGFLFLIQKIQRSKDITPESSPPENNIFNKRISQRTLKITAYVLVIFFFITDISPITDIFSSSETLSAILVTIRYLLLPTAFIIFIASKGDS